MAGRWRKGVWLGVGVGLGVTTLAVGYSVRTTSQTSVSKWRKRAFAYGVSELQGRRPYMEDRHITIPDLSSLFPAQIIPHTPVVSLFGVLDGHGGSQCADFAKVRLVENLVNNKNFSTDKKKAFNEAYLQTDQEFIRANPRLSLDVGTTAVLALLHDENKLLVANTGDSRAVLCRNGQAVALSLDHKCDDPKEHSRILKAGGKVAVVERDGPARVFTGTGQGGLAMARALGDAMFKDRRFVKDPTNPLVLPDPDIKEEIIDAKQDYFMILASDGLWDVMTSQQACDLVMNSGLSAKQASKLLVQRAYELHSSDNITALVVYFGKRKDNKEKVEEKAAPQLTSKL